MCACIHECVYLNVCTCVCVCIVCMYVCMYVCVYVFICFIHFVCKRNVGSLGGCVGCRSCHVSGCLD